MTTQPSTPGAEAASWDRRVRELRELLASIDARIAEARVKQKAANRYWRDLHETRKQAISERRALETADPREPVAAAPATRYG